MNISSSTTHLALRGNGNNPARIQHWVFAKVGSFAFLLVLSFLILLATPHGAQAAGVVDNDLLSDFDPDINSGGIISATLIQPDGKILIAGSFTTVNSDPYANIARLHADGTLDHSFIPTTVTGSIHALALQGDGKIVIGGAFSTPLNNLARLNSTGTLDVTFNPTPAPLGTVRSLVIQGDGKIIAGGNTVPFNLMRFQSNGSWEDGYLPIIVGDNFVVNALAPLPGGALAVGGNFDLVAGQAITNFVVLNYLGGVIPFIQAVEASSGPVYSLDYDWVTDQIIVGGAFNGHLLRIDFSSPNTVDVADNVNTIVTAVKAQGDGKTLFGGAGDLLNGVLGRINSNGSNDSSFSTTITHTASASINQLNFTADGDLLVTGRFTGVHNESHVSLALYDGEIQATEGVVDPRFAPSVPGPITAFAPLFLGYSVIAGNFDNIYQAGILSSTGDPIGPSYTPNKPVTLIRKTWDGRVIMGGDFTSPHTRLVSMTIGDSLVTPFPNVDGAIYDMDLSWDGKLVIGGFFQNIGLQARNYVAIFNADGTLNGTFIPNPVFPNDRPVDQVAFLPDGRVLIARDFTTVDPDNQLVLMNTNGTPAEIFSAPVFDGGDIHQIIIDPDASTAGFGIVVVGSFTSPGPYLVRLTATGTVDSSFDPTVNGEIADIVRQSDGKFIIAGDFTTVNGVSVPMIVRLDNAGNVDTSFKPGLGAVNGTPAFLSMYTDDTVFVSGDFDQFDIRPRAGLARVVRFFEPAFTSFTDPEGSIYGQEVTVQSSIYGTVNGLGGPTGAVTYTSGSELGTDTLIAGSFASTATITTTAIPNIGGNTIGINYSGDRTFRAGSSSISHSVVKDATNIIFTITPNPANYGDVVTLSANVIAAEPGSGTPSGDIYFTYGVTNPALLGDPVPLIDGVATLTLPTFTIANGISPSNVTEFAVGSHDLGASYLGDTYFNSIEADRQLLTVNRVGVTVTIEVDANSKLVDQSSIITAEVTSPAGIPTGEVVFKDGVTVIDTVLLVNGIAVLNESLALGAHSITAEYSGNVNFSPGASDAETVQVFLDGTTVTLSAAPNPVANGHVITFEATVNSAQIQAFGQAPQPTGDVRFKDGTTVLGTVALVDGIATFSTSDLVLGEHLVTADYVGDAKFAASTSNMLSVLVVQYVSSVDLTATPNPATLGDSVSLQATVSSENGTPTGNVVFKNGTTVLDTVALSDGVATFESSSLDEGEHLITAEYGGSPLHSASTSTIVNLEVVRHATSVALTATPNPVTNGESVTFEATVSSEGTTPTGSVIFKDGTTVLDTVVLEDGVATFSTNELGLGMHGITAEYNGVVAFAPSTSALVSVEVKRLATTITLTTNPTAANYGDEVTLEATVSGTGTPLGKVSFWDGTTKLGDVNLSTGKASLVVDNLAAGDHSLSANYEGSSTHVESTSSVVSLTITQATTMITMESSTSTSPFAQTIYLTATVAVNEAVMQTAGVLATTPTGFVTFKNGNETIGVMALEDGKAYLNIQTLRPGDHNITASYGANGNFTSSTSSITIQNVTLAQLGVAIEVNPTEAFDNQIITLKAIVLAPNGNPTGTVTFMDADEVLGVVVLVGDTATLSLSNLTAGRHDLVAFYNGDGGFAAQGSQPLSIRIFAFNPPLRMPAIWK